LGHKQTHEDIPRCLRHVCFTTPENENCGVPTEMIPGLAGGFTGEKWSKIPRGERCGLFCDNLE
jgi:hypothetical protein